MNCMKFSIIALLAGMFYPAFAGPAPITVPTVAALQAGNFSSYATVQVLGYNVAGDGGGGFFNWSAASTATEDHCVNFKTGGLSTGRFIRDTSATLSVLQCGAYKNNTNSAATKLAFQYATDYMQRVGSPNPNGEIYIPAGTYDLGSTGTFGVQTNNANWCPSYRGDGPGATDVKFTPSTLGSAFRFNSGIGNCNGGGVSNLRVSGNGNTTGCEFLSTSNGHCYIQGSTIGQVAIFCSCSSGGFSENDVVQILTGTSVVNRYIEYTTSGGGTGSFRHSGLAPNSYVEFSQPSFDEIIKVGAGSQLYSCPVNLSVNYQPGTLGGTVYLFNNMSANTLTCYGTLQIEVDGATNPAIFKLVRNGAVFYSGSIQPQITGTGQLVYGAISFADQSGNIGGVNSFKKMYVVLENAASAVQYLNAGTGASTTVNLAVAGSTNLCDFQIYNATTLNWAGQVLTRSSQLGAGAASVLGGTAFFGTAPTFTATTTGIPIITEADAVAANSTRIFGVCSIAGQSN